MAPFSSNTLANTLWRAETNVTFLSYEWVLQGKGDCADLLLVQDKHCHLTPLVLLYCAFSLEAHASAIKHSSTSLFNLHSWMERAFITLSTLTRKSLFTHHPKPWMSCPCWICHSLPGRHGVRIWSSLLLTTQIFLCWGLILINAKNSFIHVFFSV